jgi:hypothetical protein
MPMRGDTEWTREELARLTAHSNMLGGTIKAREMAAKNPELNQAFHRLWVCRWWRAGVGQLGNTKTAWVESPAQVLEDRLR